MVYFAYKFLGLGTSFIVTVTGLVTPEPAVALEAEPEGGVGGVVARVSLSVPFR